jgi:hypothetical protein
MPPPATFSEAESWPPSKPAPTTFGPAASWKPSPPFSTMFAAAANWKPSSSPAPVHRRAVSRPVARPSTL